MGISIEPILEQDIESVAHFLHEYMDNGITTEAWERSFDYNWIPNRPNNGFKLMIDGQIVGALVCYYCQREVRGRLHRFCNLGAWFVLPDHRPHSLRLMMRALSQRGYEFIDHTASNEVVKISQRLKFRLQDRARLAVLNLPIPWTGGIEVVEESEAIARVLSDADRAVFDDHRDLSPISHLAIGRGDSQCYVVYKKRKLKGVNYPKIIYVSNPEIFTDYLPILGRHYFLRHGAPFSMIERRQVTKPPVLSFQLSSNSNRIYRSAVLEADDFDSLYSELMLLPF